MGRDCGEGFSAGICALCRMKKRESARNPKNDSTVQQNAMCVSTELCAAACDAR